MRLGVSVAAALSIAAMSACSGDRASAVNSSPEAVTVTAPPAVVVAPAPSPRPEVEPAREPAASLTLDIPARDQAPERPKEGWCAETALQEALLYYGELVPQHEINAAGKPRMPDLYWSDVPIAMRALGLRYSPWAGGKDFDELIAWVRERIRAKQPVIAGVKLYPTDYPQWGLDHIVLIVGFEGLGPDASLVINTTWGTRQIRSLDDLRQTDEGISLANRYREFFAYAIEGLEPDAPRPVRD